MTKQEFLTELRIKGKGKFYLRDGEAIRTIEGNMCPIEFIAGTGASTALNKGRYKLNLVNQTGDNILYSADFSKHKLEGEQALMRQDMLEALELKEEN